MTDSKIMRLKEEVGATAKALRKNASVLRAEDTQVSIDRALSLCAIASRLEVALTSYCADATVHVQPAGDASMPAYGAIPWDALTAAVGEATGASFTADPSYYIGHQMCGINFNSLNRIVSKFVATSQAAIAARDARIAELERGSAAPAAAAAPVPPVEGMPDAGHPLLQRLVNSVESVDGIACVDFVLVYELRDYLAALQARINALEADLAHAHHAADLASRDAMSRIASMREEWGAEVAALTGRARRAEGCVEAVKVCVSELDAAG